MFTLSYEFHDNIPVFKSNFCGKCSGVLESTSLVNRTMRGCCWYFPKYTLVDIKNIISHGRIDFIHSLLKLEYSHISQYFIEVTGRFDSESFFNYSRTVENMPDFDNKLFFRLCPFCGTHGCNIDFSLRPHPCNLYLCRTMIEKCNDSYLPFSKERRDYYSYCNYFDESIKQELKYNRVDLISNTEASLSVIENFEMPDFEPRKLDKLIFFSEKEESVAI